MAENKNQEEYSDVVFISRIPHGFYEDEMFGFFSQFGKVRNTIVVRNSKGASKHYGYVKFGEKDVAGIAAEAMDNYLMFGVLLKCRQLLVCECFKDMFHTEASPEKTELALEESEREVRSRKRKEKLKEAKINFQCV
ncbi:MAG: RNA binding protein [Amphiamblys sp. WSBS2006]|nr:MAG: RNA binding protein [Amphiamblys sp. WSBS2006]